MTQIYDCIIIGAGISGAIAAKTLHSNNKTVAILEKSRGVGGRMATRRIDNTTFDHGAQFITTRSPEFSKFIQENCDLDITDVWCNGFYSENMQLQNDGYPRYYAKKGMTGIVKKIVSDLEVHLKCKVDCVDFNNDMWTITTDNTTFYAKHLILTAPVPQSLQILRNIKEKIPKHNWDTLQNIEYFPCITMMTTLDATSTINHPGAIKFSNGQIAWISDNKTKGISAHPSATIHTSSNFSSKHFTSTDNEIIQQLQPIIESHLKSKMIEFQIHRWRYCEPKTIYPQACFFDNNLKLAICGDAFAGPKVEGAFVSGIDAAHKILNLVDI